jgi:ABC-2 type transport system permease protein
MNRPFVNLVALQFKEFFREPELIFWAFALPIVLSWLLGIAIGSGGQMSRKVALIEDERSSEGFWRSWIESAHTMPHQGEESGAGSSLGESRTAVKSGAIQFLVLGREEAILALKKGKVSLFIERSPGSGELTYYFDPRNGEAQMTHLMLERSLASPPPQDRVVALAVQGTRYIDFLVPGLLAMEIMNSALWGIGWALIEIRMKKLLRRMSATPMRKHVFLGSYFVTRLLVNAIEFFALYVFALLYFGVRIQGNPLALLLVFIAGNMAFAGIAIFTSSRTSNPRVGNGLINAITFPMMLLSGIFFSYHNFPGWAIPLVQRLPLTMLTDAMRSIFNEGAGFPQVALPAFILSTIGFVFFYWGQRIYKWY